MGFYHLKQHLEDRLKERILSYAKPLQTKIMRELQVKEERYTELHTKLKEMEGVNYKNETVSVPPQCGFLHIRNHELERRSLTILDMQYDGRKIFTNFRRAIPWIGQNSRSNIRRRISGSWRWLEY